MVFWRRRRSGTAVLAVLALLALGLVPSVSRALSPLAPAQFIADLCRGADDGTSQPGSHGGADALLACGLCTLAAAPLLPPAAPPVALALRVGAESSVQEAAAPAVRLPHAPAQARAPPARA
jgi:Protein of unknown function (DUF2946)